MVRLSRFAAWVLVPALLALPGRAAAPTPPPPAGRSGTAPAEDPAVRVRRLVEQARSAFLDAEFEAAAAAVEEALAALRDAAGAMDPAEQRSLAATALDLLAQSRFNLGDDAGMNEAIRRLLAVDPSWRVDVEVAGPKYAQLFEAKRTALVGSLAVECAPLPCETIELDGTARTPGEEGRIPVVAGTYHVVARRHGFAPADLGKVEVPAGQEKRLAARLRQVARDVVLVTDPAGAEVSLDGTSAGTTAPGAGEGASASFVLRDLAPGRHVLVVSAPCRRRVEQSFEVVLDEKDPGPLALPPIRLQEARGVLEIDWTGAEGVLSVDGSPADPGQRRVCPGKHEVSLAVGGRRVFFARVPVRDGETVTVHPRPRPTLAVPPGGAGPFPFLGSETWNRVELAPAAVEKAGTLLARVLGDGKREIPTWPRIDRRLAPEAAAPLLAAAPEADLVALPLPVDDPVRGLDRLVLVDPRRGIVEAVAWRPGDREAPGEIDGALAWAPPSRDPWLGLDLAERVAGPPLVARVAEGSPAAAAGIRAGELLLAVGGHEVASMADAEARIGGLAPGAEVELRLRGEEERAVRVTPRAVVHVESPAGLAGRILLPALARAAVLRIAGRPEERIPAAVAEGLLLAASGSALAAAQVLDRVSVDAAEDPEGDARGTVLFVLEGLLRRLDREEYAGEIAARLAELPRARLGGRHGPPLALAPRD